VAGTILALGEVLWDRLPTGPVLGGAPANFAYHARALGADATLVSRVGDDEPGREILRRLAVAGIQVAALQVDAERPTGTVSVELSADGRPQYIIPEAVAWDAIEVNDAGLTAARRADAVAFGTLAQRSALSGATIRRLVAETPAGALRVFDVNLRQPFYSPDVIESSLALANVVKLSNAELSMLAEMYSLDGDVAAQLCALARRFSLRAIALTRGGCGSVLWADGEYSEHPGIETTVRDTIGAGDSFAAAFALGLLAGWPVHEINQLANEVAGFVSSHAGATPPLPASFRQRFHS
jgi:fructokinase